MKRLLIVTGDTNDADYVTEISDVTSLTEEELETLRKVGRVMREETPQFDPSWGRHEFVDDSPEKTYRGLLTQEEIDLFDTYIPNWEHGIHSISEVRLLTVVDDEKLL